MEKRLCVVRSGLLVLGLTLMALGLLRAENATVFKKATHICLECIGIG